MTSLSALRIRLLVLFAALALLVAATALVFMARGRNNSAAQTPPAVTTARAPVVHTRHTHAARPRTKIHVAAATTLPSGFPIVLHRALEHRAVIVVSLVVGGGVANDAAVAEARAAAASSGSGFMRIDVGHNGLARTFATLMGSDTLLPATLVLKRPGSVAVRFDGYYDRTVLAQAAHNARA